MNVPRLRRRFGIPFLVPIAWLLLAACAIPAAGEPGNLDGRDGVAMADALLALQVLAGVAPADATPEAAASDVDGDGAAGLAEAVFILQTVAELRPAEPGAGACLSPEEAELADLVNQYRIDRGLPAVPISRTLTAVARWHVWDLGENGPYDGECNLHSWSDARPALWNAVCYTPDHAHATEMWEKPAQISGGAYTGHGYENAYLDFVGAAAAAALAAWRNNPSHDDVILEQGTWIGSDWPAMGAGIRGNFAVLWFGRQTDPAGTVAPCP